LNPEFPSIPASARKRNHARRRYQLHEKTVRARQMATRGFFFAASFDKNAAVVQNQSMLFIPYPEPSGIAGISR
jgi:hypothetical protein